MARRTIELMQRLVFPTSILHYKNLEIHVIDCQLFDDLYVTLIWLIGLNSWMIDHEYWSPLCYTIPNRDRAFWLADSIPNFSCFQAAVVRSRTEYLVLVNNPNSHASAVCIVHVHRYFLSFVLICFEFRNFRFRIISFAS